MRALRPRHWLVAASAAAVLTGCGPAYSDNVCAFEVHKISSNLTGQDRAYAVEALELVGISDELLGDRDTIIRELAKVVGSEDLSVQAVLAKLSDSVHAETAAGCSVTYDSAFPARDAPPPTERPAPTVAVTFEISCTDAAATERAAPLVRAVRAGAPRLLGIALTFRWLAPRVNMLTERGQELLKKARARIEQGDPEAYRILAELKCPVEAVYGVSSDRAEQFATALATSVRGEYHAD
jgi:hypothetical protein